MFNKGHGATMSKACATVRSHLTNEVGGFGRGCILRTFKIQTKAYELYPEVSREAWKVVEQLRVMVKAVLGHLTLEKTNHCVDGGWY